MSREIQVMESPGVCGIYKITCIPTGDFYIGAAKNIEKRRKQHWAEMRRGHHLNGAIRYLASVYDRDSFVMEVLQGCNQNELKHLELDWVYRLSPTLNATTAVMCSVTGQVKWTPNLTKSWRLNNGILFGGVFFTHEEWVVYLESEKLSCRLARAIENIRDLEKSRAIQSLINYKD